MPETLKLSIPQSFDFTPKVIEEIQLQNHKYQFGIIDNQFIINCSKEQITEIFELYFPVSILQNDDFLVALADENQDYKLEVDQSKIYISRMGTIEVISAFTALIIFTLTAWARYKKNGKVYSESAGYHLKAIGQKRCPDASFIDFEDVAREILKQNKHLEHPPTLALEVISNEYDLPKEIQKMEKAWMKAGTKVGVLVNPYTQKYMVFEGKSKQEFDFKTVFKHQKLDELEIDFDALWREASDE